MAGQIDMLQEDQKAATFGIEIYEGPKNAKRKTWDSNDNTHRDRNINNEEDIDAVEAEEQFMQSKAQKKQ